MSEIIPLHVGGYGCRVGLQLLKKLRAEHEGDDGQWHGRQTFFAETAKQPHQYRGLFLDQDSSLYDMLVASGVNVPFESMILGNSTPSRNLFPSTFYNIPIEYKAERKDKIRQQAQQCDRLSGFMLTYAASGGTGSGLAASLIQQLSQIGASQIRESHLLLPDITNKHNPDTLSLYNTLLTANYFEDPTIIICYQNQAVLKAHDSLKQSIGINFMNDYLAQCMTDLTAPYRFSGLLNTSQRKMCTNLIPFPRLKFMVPSVSRLGEKNCVLSAFDRKQKLVLSNHPYQQNIIASAVNVRGGCLTDKDVENSFKSAYRIQKKSTFIEWIKNKLHISYTHQTNRSKTPTTSILMSSASNVDWMRNLSPIFTKMFRRRAFLHHYTSAGMEEMEFTEAQSNLNDLIHEYPQNYHCEYEEYDDYSEEYEEQEEEQEEQEEEEGQQ